MNLYEILGIERDATPEMIKRAYRRKSREAHPDREGGSTDEQQRVNKAYEVLSDPERRARYDRTGYMGGVVNIDAPAREMIFQAVAKAMDHERAPSPLQDALDELRARAMQTQNSANFGAQKAERMRKQIARLKRKDGAAGEDFLSGMLKDALGRIENEVERAKSGLDIINRAVQLLEEGWTFEAEEGAYAYQVFPSRDMYYP